MNNGQSANITTNAEFMSPQKLLKILAQMKLFPEIRLTLISTIKILTLSAVL